MIMYTLSTFLQTIDSIKYIFREKIADSKYINKLFYKIYYLYIKKKLCNNVKKINIINYDTLMDFCKFATTKTDTCRATVYYHDDKEDNIKLEIIVDNTKITYYIINHFDKMIKVKVESGKTIIMDQYYKEIVTDKKVISDAALISIKVIQDYIIDYINDKIIVK